MNPMIIGGLISAAGSLGGGLLGNKSNESSAAAQARMQKEFAQYGIRWRVADAKAAGLHPLYALGAQLPSYSPSFAMDSIGPALASAGQDVGRAIAAQETVGERSARMLQARLIDSQIKESDARAGLARAETLRALRDAGPGFPQVNMPEQALLGETANTAGGAVLKAPEVTMSRPGSGGVVAGPANPSMREFRLPGTGQKILLPDASSLGEALESLSESWLLGLAVYNENVKTYGEDWRVEFLRSYLPKAIQQFMPSLKPRKFRQYVPESRRDVKRDMDRLINEMR